MIGLFWNDTRKLFDLVWYDRNKWYKINQIYQTSAKNCCIEQYGKNNIAI